MLWSAKETTTFSNLFYNNIFKMKSPNKFIKFSISTMNDTGGST